MNVCHTLYTHIFPSTQSTSNANNLEKKQRAFDKTVQEWKTKVKDLEIEIDRSHKETRNYSTELYRVKAQLEEAQDGTESLRRENKNLSGKLNRKLLWWTI